MCGIVGFSWKDEIAIKKAVQVIKHRGPDDDGIFTDDNLSLGHVRLSIIDTSSAAHQPFVDKETNRILIFNGEIYNFKEIKKSLFKKYTFSSNSDTELILKAYDAWGEQCVQKFNGMWSFCIYDPAKKELFFSRDRFGKKPLYYSLTKKGIVFSSEMKAILPFITPTVNESMVSDFLYYDFLDHTDDTFITEIKKLPAGTNAFFSFNDSSFTMKKYYTLQTSTSSFKKVFTQACEYRTVADVPISISLSGGVDSSSIAAVYVSQKRKIKAFTTTSKSGRGDETQNINYLLDEYPKMLDLKKIPIDIDNYIDVLRECVYHIESPTIGGVIPRWMIAKGVRQNGYKVLISGEGADEMLGGYRSAYPYIIASEFKKWHLSSACNLIRLGKEYLGKRELGFMAFYLSPKWAKKVIITHASKNMQKNLGYTTPFYIQERLRTTHFKHAEDYFTYGLWSGGIPPLLKYNDKIPMAFGVEVRCPFLDVNVVEKIMSLKASERVARGYTKYYLRKALSTLVPRQIIWDKKKVGFQSPEAEYLALPTTKEYVVSTFSKSPKCGTYIDNKVFLSAYQNFLATGKGNISYFVKVISLELWLQQFME